MISSFIKGGEWTFSQYSQLSLSTISVYAVGITLIFFTTALLMMFRPKKVRVNKSNGRVFSKDDPEIIIIGSGVAGSAMATVFARDGRKVTVIERDLKEPDRIVGELLQPGGLNALIKLGLGDCVKEIDAHKISGYVLHSLDSKSEVVIPYSVCEESLGQKLNADGAAFHHGRFIMALREQAMKEPNVTYVEGTATKLIEENGIVTGVQYKLKNEEESKEVYAPLTFVVDGCFSKFRKELVKESVKVTSHFVGLLMHHCPQKKSNHAEIVLMTPSPVLVYQISSDCTRVLVDIKGVLPKNMKEYLLDNVCPQLPEHIQEPFKDGVINGRIRSMPNSYLPPSPIERPGVLVLGDAYNMRHPLTGGGMSVCLNDVFIWRDLLKTIPDLTDYESIIKSLRVFHLRRKNTHSFVVNVLANALYELFSADNTYLVSMKRACLEYFKLGGECVAGPVSLLSVLNPKPHILVGHFFAVALYAVYYVFLSEPFWAIHRVLYRSFMIFFTACTILFPLIWAETKTLLFT
ncbi:squalene monooxygenase [Biomphalaria pfeifferi]|uniref:Squalene monooxygenase n=1 Tax=Biomphalaria pfeifferi TaxID=112525 RepID=A0AAD8CBR3_BIOPF|nr:squalene monooxygenase [Biomphalaria pfeifferi]